MYNNIIVLSITYIPFESYDFFYIVNMYYVVHTQYFANYDKCILSTQLLKELAILVYATGMHYAYGLLYQEVP